MDWDDYFMTLVYLTAMKSKDSATHLGAVIVDKDNTILSIGYNGLPRGLEYNHARLQRPEKYYWFEHAERNAIYNAIRIGVDTSGSTLYTNGTPCCDCARAVIQSGIKKVIVDKEWDNQNQDVWLEQAQRSKIMFEEVNIELVLWEGKIYRQIEKFRRGKQFRGN